MRMDGKLQTPAGTVRAPGMERRLDTQAHRIGTGVQNGSIGPREAGALGHMNQIYNQHLTQAKADDGVVDLQERMGLHRDLNKISGAIHDFRHNGPGGPGGSGGPGGPGGPGPMSKTTTDEDGNQVTRTRDGYSQVEGEDGSTTTTTPGGYEISYDPDGSSLTMTDPRSGESTNIWGDPHVSESDEGGSFWDYDSATSTFMLPDGTKITTQATSADGTLTDVDIYSGNGRSHFSSSIDTDGNISNDYAADARRADAAQDDGDVYFGNLRLNDWYAGSPWGEEVASDRSL